MKLTYLANLTYPIPTSTMAALLGTSRQTLAGRIKAGTVVPSVTLYQGGGRPVFYFNRKDAEALLREKKERG